MVRFGPVRFGPVCNQTDACDGVIFEVVHREGTDSGA